MAILGGGPSLTPSQVEASKRLGRVVAVNNAYRLAPGADVLWFCDQRWWEWHRARPEFVAFAGIKATLENRHLLGQEPGLLCFRNDGVQGLCLEADGVRSGSNSGYQALNLAVNMGARRILLLGFDMRAVKGRANWHDDHKIRMPESVFARMLDNYRTIVEPLRKLGVEVTNCTAGSALTLFPFADVEDM